ncbi:MAG: hypothetical protein KA250_06485 [Verrucomicrobiales bacterium]|jgi:hypothetical protein|nr:hypothetical protein [Verrucomicrobiales bacterium]HQZ27197.1 hypothetical protein [Verrucomicrobiales bacterium]
MPSLIDFALLAQDSAGPDELYDIIVLAPERPIWPLVFYVVVGLILLGLMIWLICYFLKSHHSRKTSESPTIKAVRILKRLEQSRSEIEPNHFSLSLSETLKDFLAETFSDPVRFETTQEFLRRIATESTRLPPAAQEGLKAFLLAAEEVKFGNPADAEMRTEPLLHQAKGVISLCSAINSDGARGKKRKS